MVDIKGFTGKHYKKGIGVGGLGLAFLAAVLFARGCEGPMTDSQKKLHLALKEKGYEALRVLESTAADEKIDLLENREHLKLKRSLEGLLNQTADDSEEMHSETREYLTDVLDEVKRAISHFDGKGKFGYSIIIYGKRKDGKTICFGESDSEHTAGRLYSGEISEDDMRKIVGERNFNHLRENTDAGFTPVRVLKTRDGKQVYVVNMNAAMQWTELTNVDMAKELGKYFRQLASDMAYLTDGQPETGTFWKLKSRRHAFGAGSYKGPSMKAPANNYGARTRGAGNR